MDDFYDQLKMSSNDNIKLILTTENEYQDSDDSSTDVEEFVEVDFKKNNEESNKRTIDSTDEIGSDMENENGRRYNKIFIIKRGNTNNLIILIILIILKILK